MMYSELLRKVKEEYGRLSSREEQIVYTAIDRYVKEYNSKEEQFKMELASQILIHNTDDVLHGIGKKEPLIDNCFQLATMFTEKWKSRLDDRKNVLPEPTKRTEMRIGETREFDGAIYRCVAANGRDCECCALFNKGGECDFFLGECLDERREDGTSVLFEKEGK